MSLEGPPNCLPNCPVEHASVNLATILATHLQAQWATQLRAVFVLRARALTVKKVQALAAELRAAAFPVLALLVGWYVELQAQASPE